MARITTTDCERIVPNRFELVVLAAARARELLRGDEPASPGQRRSTAGDRVTRDRSAKARPHRTPPAAPAALARWCRERRETRNFRQNRTIL